MNFLYCLRSFLHVAFFYTKTGDDLVEYEFCRVPLGADLIPCIDSPVPFLGHFSPKCDSDIFCLDGSRHMLVIFVLLIVCRFFFASNRLYIGEGLLPLIASVIPLMSDCCNVNETILLSNESIVSL
jgi:hypothetical protein